MISKVNGLDLSEETVEDLELLLSNELFINIDSPFAKELEEELNNRPETKKSKE